MQLVIAIYQDGDNDPAGLCEIISGWIDIWKIYYAHLAELSFSRGSNLKLSSTLLLLPEQVRSIVNVRNPDIYFREITMGIELGGVEITVHSPDGSNVEKRYPYLWASRKNQVNALISCPYSKERPNGQINRLPYRHSKRNFEFLNEWLPNEDENSVICQIVPTVELQPPNEGASEEIKKLMLGWADIGGFFAHTLAAKVFSGEALILARTNLNTFRDRLIHLANACMKNTKDTDPSSLIKGQDRWIQVYNIRPEVGHWERGEGQFDSIDGRIMFTLDEISLMPEDKRPMRFEFWLPQIVSKHPWIIEQIERGYGSKRFRNIHQILSNICITKFADDLTDEDWQLLEVNPSLLLERLDWQPAVYKVTKNVPNSDIQHICRVGLVHYGIDTLQEIERLLGDQNLYFSTHRAYIPNWKDDLQNTLSGLPDNAVVLIPRIPKQLLVNVIEAVKCNVITADNCTKLHLLMLRQIHRSLGQELVME